MREQLLTPCQIVVLVSLILFIIVFVYNINKANSKTCKIEYKSNKEKIINRIIMFYLIAISAYYLIYPSLFQQFGKYEYIKVEECNIDPLYNDIYIIGNINDNNKSLLLFKDRYQKYITLNNVNYSIVTNGNKIYKVEKYITKPKDNLNRWFLGRQYHSEEKYVFYLDDISQIQNIDIKEDIFNK